MFLPFEAAPAMTLPANDDALVAKVVAARAALTAHFAAAVAAQAARIEEFEAAGWEAM